MKFKAINVFMLICLIVVSFSCLAYAQDDKSAVKKDKPKKDTEVKKDEKPLEYIQINTGMGNIVVELNREKAPLSVANFLNYVDKNFYDNTIFHRIISSFMIQAGGYSVDLKPKPADPPIHNEWDNGLKNVRGAIAMGRTNAPHSATCHFFINVVDNAMLDQPRGGAAYAVFGMVLEGMDVVDKIKAVKTGRKGGMADVPIESMMIETILRIEKPKADKK